MRRNPTPAEVQRAMSDTEQLWKPAVKPSSANGFTAVQLEATRTALRSSLERLDAIKTDCHQCLHFDMERCKLHDADIPIEFQRQADACGDWQWDSIPF